jgi:hypothetical protein
MSWRTYFAAFLVSNSAKDEVEFQMSIFCAFGVFRGHILLPVRPRETESYAYSEIYQRPVGQHSARQRYITQTNPDSIAGS